jgi:hypothetical protein
VIALYSLALAVTLIVEMPIVAAFYPGQRIRMALACAIATTATTLALNVALARAHLAWGEALVSGESIALVIEAAVYAYVAQRGERGWSRALAASAAANLASYGAGRLFF